MALLKCTNVSEGLRSSEATVTIAELDGTSQFLPIDRGVLTRAGGHDYLTVSIIFLDESREAALVGLPVEADSGAHRVWVKCDDFPDRFSSDRLDLPVTWGRGDLNPHLSA
jgi:hypothetical protein